MSSPCHHKANCTDTEGSYKCTCIDGYVGDGKDCKPGKSMYYCFLGWTLLIVVCSDISH